MSDYIIEATSKFEGLFTAEEIELNNKLYQECVKDKLDCTAIEELLDNGADPLGATAVSGRGLFDHIYGEIIYDLAYDQGENLPRITELFLRHGMDIEKPRVPYDDKDSIHPMWMFKFLSNENTLLSLKMLLDTGISADSVRQLWDHVTCNLIFIDCGDPNSDAFWHNECLWAMKLLMFCASYDHILDNDEDLQRFIGCSYNSYDLHEFRKWDSFYYEFDTSHCNGFPQFCGLVVRIYEKETRRKIWTVGICLNEGEF